MQIHAILPHVKTMVHVHQLKTYHRILLIAHVLKHLPIEHAKPKVILFL